MNSRPFHEITALALCALAVWALAPARALGQDYPSTDDQSSTDRMRAQKAVERGEKAERAGHIDEALVAYDEAAKYAPRDLAVVGHGAELRSRLIRGHVENAERLALAGKVSAAKQELNVAMRIDPTDGNVAERLSEMDSMQDDEPLPRTVKIAGLPEVKPRSEKQSFDIRGDTRTVYEQVAAAFGIKATFDPDVVSRNVHFQLQNVDFNTALSILGSETATFWRPLDAKTIFVAPDTIEKRRMYGLQAEQTFLLSGSVNPEDMTELLRTLREITGATHINLDAASRTITIRDAPETLRLAGELIRQLERARGEVMLDMDLLEVDRNKAQQLGITPPSSWKAVLITPQDINALSKASDLANALTILGQLLSANGISPNTGFTTFGGGYTRFLLTLPGWAANFSDALSLVQSGQQVLLRAQNNKPATFFVGDRYPVTLSLLSGSLGTSGSAGNAQTPSLGAISSANFPETTFAVGNNPVALTAADFNGDGLPDLAVANQGDSTVTILLNQNSGNFAAANGSPIVLPKTESGPVAIASGVFRNGITGSNGVPISTPDLLVVNSATDNVSVFFGKGDGTFTESTNSPIAVGKTPSSIVVADFNGDGNLDFAVAHAGDNTISVFEGNGQGQFTQARNSPFALTNTSTISEKGPVALVTANFQLKTLRSNGAAEADLAVVNHTSNNVSILLGSLDNSGNLVFTESPDSPIAVGNSPVAIATGDLNQDSIPDLAVVNQADNTISVLLGNSNANGTFSPATGSPLPTSATPAGITIADFAGNTPDLAVTNKGPSTLAIYVGLGGGTFSSRLEVGTPASPGAIVSSILTNSGLPDVAFVAQGTTPNQGLVTIVQDSTAFASSVGTGGVGQTPYPASEYVDLGVKIKATPTLHANHEVTLQLEFEIRALSGSSVNGIPIITNRTISQTVRVKDDETSVISGLLDNEETRSLTGLPGFANLPGIGYAFGNRKTQLQDTEFLILITPRMIRDAVRSAPAIFAGRGEAGTQSPARFFSPRPE